MKKANDITKWENVKGHIFLHLVNYERYKAELADIVYVPFLDLVILFHCSIKETDLAAFMSKRSIYPFGVRTSKVLCRLRRKIPSIRKMCW